MSAKPRRKRTPGLSARVMEQFRGNIVSGNYAPGDRLPTFDHLIKIYGVSRATMQQIVKQLREEGFILSINREGLFVADPPPYLSRFAVVYPNAPGEKGWSRFNTAFLNECNNLFRKNPQISVENYFDVRAHQPGEDFERLIEDIRCHRVAGVILHRHTQSILEHPVVKASGVPVVGIYFLPGDLGEYPVINTDYAMFMDRAFNWFSSKRRKRVACLTIGTYNALLTPERVREHGFEIRQHWMCSIGRDHTGHIPNLVRLLFDYPPEERPDALYIDDDNLVEETLGTVHDMGLHVGRDLDIVIHCNWPLPAPSFLPIAHLGTHIHDFLYHAIGMILAQRSGQTPPREVFMPTIFEEEMRSREPLSFEFDVASASAK